MPSSKIKTSPMCFTLALKGWWKNSLNININQSSHRNYQSVLKIPNKFNISNNNQEDFKYVLGKDMEYRWENLWPCGAKNPGNKGLLPTHQHHFFSTSTNNSNTYITFNSNPSQNQHSILNLQLHHTSFQLIPNS